jgi:hypothetical protein
MHKNLSTFLLLCLLVPIAPGPFVSGQEPAADTEFPRVEDWRLLRDDPRLKKGVFVDLQEATVGDIVSLLSEQTGVPLSIDAAQAKERFGVLKGSGPAWKMMRELVVADGVHGRWEASGNGYHLRFQRGGTQPTRLIWVYFVAIPACLAVMLLLSVVWRRTPPRRRKLPPSPNTRAAGVGPED